MFWEIAIHKKFVNFLLKNSSLSLFYVKSQPAIECWKLTTETLEQGVKYIQS